VHHARCLIRAYDICSAIRYLFADEVAKKEQFVKCRDGSKYCCREDVVERMLLKGGRECAVVADELREFDVLHCKLFWGHQCPMDTFLVYNDRSSFAGILAIIKGKTVLYCVIVEHPSYIFIIVLCSLNPVV